VSLDEVPGKHLIFIEESEIQRYAETTVAPTFTLAELPMENDTPNVLTYTDPDEGKLEVADDTDGAIYERVSEHDPVPNAETISESDLEAPRECNARTFESDDQMVDFEADNPILTA